jgi:hypothetical protein
MLFLPRTRALGRALLLTAAASLIFACARQGEGERCDLRSGSRDCESGLVCTPSDDLHLPGTEGRSGIAVCCPPEGQPSSVAGCQRRGIDIPGIDEDAAAPAPAPDGGS